MVDCEISDMRNTAFFSTAGGHIIASQGFVVAGDKRSCLFDSAQVEKLLSSHSEQVALFVEWELGAN